MTAKIKKLVNGHELLLHAPIFPTTIPAVRQDRVAVRECFIAIWK